jgi:hypothetical protein
MKIFAPYTKLSAVYGLDPNDPDYPMFQQMTPAYLAKANEVAAQLSTMLNASLANHDDTHILLIARQGNNQEGWGVFYTHTAFLLAYPDGSYEVCHLIHDNKVGTSMIRVQGLPQFFMDDLYSFHHAVWAIEPAVQTALLDLLYTDKDLLHNPLYNALASHLDVAYQNCNLWAMEMASLAALRRGEWQADIDHKEIEALPTVSARREILQSMVHAHGYVPDTVQMSGWFKTLIPWISSSAKLDDHRPSQEASHGVLTFAAAKSIVDFFAHKGLIDPVPLLEERIAVLGQTLLHSPGWVEQWLHVDAHDDLIDLGMQKLDMTLAETPEMMPPVFMVEENAAEY